MVTLSSLWLPIVLSGVAVFFLSFVMWMLVGHHKSDFKKLAREDDVVNALRAAGVTEGQYMFPHCSHSKQMKDPAFIKKFETGPSGMLIVRPSGPYAMGKAMGQTVAFCVICCFAVAYVAHVAFRAGAAPMEVFRLTATVAWMTFSFAHVWKAIWAGMSWSETIKSLFDGLVYALATGAIFAWRWPAA